jgi:antitoxin component YwqK of YwqJK toxin-antitoxin module
MVERAAGVPEDAFWDDDGWCLASRDDDEEYHGTVTWWREDGTRCCVAEYVHGVQEGPCTRYHENGEVAFEGRFAGGERKGPHVWTRSSDETTEEFPEGAEDEIWRVEIVHDGDDEILGKRAFLEDGTECMQDGTPFPDERPDGVPEGARFGSYEDDEFGWIQGVEVAGEDGARVRSGPWRIWDAEGVLLEEAEYDSGELHGWRRTYDSGELACETAWARGKEEGIERVFEEGELVEERTHADGALTGPFRKRRPPGSFELEDAVEQRGTYRSGAEVGRIELLDGSGAVVHRVDLGEPTDPMSSELQDVLGADADADFVAIASAASKSSKFRVALLALVRAAAKGADAEPVRGFLAAHRIPLAGSAADEQTTFMLGVLQRCKDMGVALAGVIDCLLRDALMGGDFPRALQEMARSVMDYGKGAHEWLRFASHANDVALLLAPDRTAFEVTRALVRLSEGNFAGARASVAVLRDGDRPNFVALSPYVAAYVPSWTFWPADDGRLAEAAEVTPYFKRTTMKSKATIDHVRSAVMTLATRLMSYRKELEPIERGRGWLLPDLSHLLPDGPLDVYIPDRQWGTSLQHPARRDWMRLTWLLWLSGHDTLVLPTDLGPARPSLPVRYMNIAREQVLREVDVNVRDRLEGADFVEANDIETLQTLFEKAARSATWYGGELPKLLQGASKFAHEDECALFFTFAFWNNPEADLFKDEREDREEAGYES